MKIESKFEVWDKVKFNVRDNIAVGKVLEVAMDYHSFKYLIEFIDEQDWYNESLIHGKAERLIAVSYQDGRSDEEHFDDDMEDDRKEIVSHMNQWRKHYHNKFKDNECFWEMYNEELKRTLEGIESEIPGECKMSIPYFKYTVCS